MKAIDTQFLDVLSGLTDSINSFGYNLASPTRFPNDSLEQVPLEVKRQITFALQQYMDVISEPTSTPFGNPFEPSRERDVSHFNLFMKVASVKLADERFMDHFEKGDICEAYSHDHQQIFRNLEFFRRCSYDLYTLTMLPWHMLFKRPESVQLQLANLAEYILLKGVPGVPYPVPAHIIQECYADHHKAFIYTIKRAGVLLDTVTNQPKGYLTIIKVQDAGEGQLAGFIN